MTFTEFCESVRAGIARGEIKTSADLTDLDLAIQYAIGQEQQARDGGEITTTAAEIYGLIGKYCGADIQQKLFDE